jgi:hypothetical protein
MSDEIQKNPFLDDKGHIRWPTQVGIGRASDNWLSKTICFYYAAEILHDAFAMLRPWIKLLRRKLLIQKPLH